MFSAVNGDGREPTVTWHPPCADSGPEAFPAFSPLLPPTSLLDKKHHPVSQMEKEREVK